MVLGQGAKGVQGFESLIIGAKALTEIGRLLNLFLRCCCNGELEYDVDTKNCQEIKLTDLKDQTEEKKWRKHEETK